MTATPVFVLGPYHSGTTILYRMLAMHPDATWLSQFSQRDGGILGRRRLPFHRSIDRISRALFRYSWEGKSRKGLLQFIVAKPYEAQSVWQYVIPKDEEPDLELVAGRIERVLRTESRVGRTHLFIKDPYLSLRVPVLKAVCPEAKYVHIVRDGRAVALSLQAKILRTFHSGGASASEEREILARVARYWTKVVSSVEGAGEVTELRYEDFCTDVRGQLRRVLNNIGLEEDRFPYERCPKSLTPTNPRWMQSAPRAIETVEGIQEAWLRRYGYL